MGASDQEAEEAILSEPRSVKKPMPLKTTRATRLALLLLLALPAVVQAQFTFVTTGGTITIMGYTGLGGAVTIPSTINDLPVTRIGDQAFSYCNSLTSITIPASVTSIGDAAFYACDSLMAITVDALNSVYSSVDGVVFNQSQTMLVQWPGGKAGSYTIPNNVTSIGDYAFAGTRLTNVTILNNVTRIGTSAFFGSDLTSVTIGISVTSIGDHAFAGCDSLTAMTVDALNSFYSSVAGVLFNQSLTVLLQYPRGKAGSDYTIGNSVTNIGASAFANCFSLTTVTIGNSVTRIGNDAFFGSGLTSVTIPNSVTSIGDQAFYYCTSLTSVTIPNSVTSIGGGAFQYCNSLTNVTIGNGVTSVGDGAFADCYSLTAITVDALNSFYSSVAGVLFNQSQTLLLQYPRGKAGSDYTIGNSVTNIGASAFANCSILTNVTIGNSVTSIGEDAFFGSGLTSVTIPNSVINIGHSAFADCSSLTSVTIGNSVTSIGSWAFFHCASLTSITIPSSVTNIGAWAFSHCPNLTNVTIPNSVTSIGRSAFADCSSLTSVTIPNSITNIGYYAFAYCANLMEVYFQGNAPSVDSLVFVNSDNATVYYLPGTTGWGPTFGGNPTKLWSLPYPLILNNGPGFGVRTNQFGFIISWANNLSVVVEACTDLANPIWSSVETNTLTDGASYFSDPQWTNYRARFYRIRSP